MKTLNKVERSQMFHQLIKALSTSNVIDVSLKIMDCYKSKLYTGQEHEYITNIYFRSIHLSMWIWMGQNATYFKQDKEHDKFVNNFISKELQKVKVETYKYRVKLYHTWLAGEKNCKFDNTLLSMLFKQYPNANYCNEVRVALDLVLSDENSKVSRLANEQKD